jgi:hypothetical protein
MVSNGRTLAHDKSSHGLWPGELKTLFDLEVKGLGPTKVIMVSDTPSYGHASGYLFIENCIMAEIFQPSDKIKLIFILF